ncbi:protease modulator HflC [Aquisediminimonas profunda]|uniref:protease modulator HflC n=1 Tax=Aquisediminimonas profunda TaxID=1550733 RepID=UPI001C632E5D|nr:protease modulator HflC [Aquisediminimonas profunda]
MSYDNPTALGRFLANPLALLVAALAGLILLISTVSIVPETKQGVVLRLSKIDRVVNGYKEGQAFGSTGAGLVAKIPFIEDIVWIDKRILDVDMDPQQVLSTDQLRLNVDAYARYRIVDPVRMYSAARTVENVSDALRPILGSALRNELGKRKFAELLSPERDRVMDNIQAGLERVAQQYGAEIVDVRIKRADLPEGTPLDSAYERMRTARTQEALTIEADGFRQAQIIRAEADAKSAQIYAAAFGKDPEFYDFYRAMQSYRQTFGVNGKTNGSTNIILSPGNDYLSEFRGGK